MAIGRKVQPLSTTRLAEQARSLTANLPNLLIEAEKIAVNAAIGWHGRRKRGVGENFWQFRPFTGGEALTAIDWRRSAREDAIFIRDREWDSAQTVWLWLDCSSSMRFCSQLSSISKLDRGLLLSFVLAKLLGQSGEKIGIPGILAPTNSRHQLEQMALALSAHHEARSFPHQSNVTPHSIIIIISDFLDDIKAMVRHLTLLANQSITAILIEVSDPAEELFPYHGRVEFKDLESSLSFIFGHAESLKERYQLLYFARRQELVDYSARYGWGFLTDYTNRPISETIYYISNLVAYRQRSSKGVQ